MIITMGKEENRIILKSSDGKTETEVDLTEVIDLKNNLEKVLLEQEMGDGSVCREIERGIELYDRLNDKQRQYLVNVLFGVLHNTANMFSWVCDNPEKIIQYRDLIKKAKETINYS